MIGKLKEFAEQLERGLEEADWSTRREIIRTLVKQIEVKEDQNPYRVPGEHRPFC